MTPWLKYLLSILVGLALGAGARLVVVTLTAPDSVNVEAACWESLLRSRCWTHDSAGAVAVQELWAHRDAPDFQTTFLFNTTEVVASAYSAYATCVDHATTQKTR